jgi:hypothetical protein
MMFRETKAIVTQYGQCSTDSESGARVSCIEVSPFYVNYELCFYQQHFAARTVTKCGGYNGL